MAEPARKIPSPYEQALELLRELEPRELVDLADAIAERLFDFEVAMPLSESHQNEIEIARREIAEGKYITLDELRTKYGL
ncbi:MAG: hypothetical protein ACHQ50_15365 [Fimbriimonadales bacterium]